MTKKWSMISRSHGEHTAALTAFAALALAQPAAAQDVGSALDLMEALSDPDHDVCNEEDLAGFHEAMQALGYSVECGKVRFLEGVDGYGANPSTIYGSYFFPTGAADGSLDHTNRLRLSRDEALLLLGTTPPEVHYFGIQTYLYERQDWDVFASLGDAFNMRNIVSLDGNGLGRQGLEARFGGLAAVLSTADDSTAGHVTEALTALLGDSEITERVLNLELLPEDTLEMGTESQHDVLMPIIRVTPPSEGIDPDGYQVARDYMALDHDGEQVFSEGTPSPPLVALRITPAVSHGDEVYYYQREVDIEPFLTDRDIPPVGEVYEHDLLGIQDMDDEIVEILERIAAEYPGWTAAERQLMDSEHLDGYRCIDEGRDCLGDTRDTAYRGYGPLLLDTWGHGSRVLYVVGVRHTDTGMASYVNVAVNASSSSTGLVSVLDTQLEDSASAWVGNDLADRIWVMAISRDCDGIDSCLEVPYRELGWGQAVTVAVRAYVNPLTGVGPSYDDIVHPWVLSLTPTE